MSHSRYGFISLFLVFILGLSVFVGMPKTAEGDPLINRVSETPLSGVHAEIPLIGKAVVANLDAMTLELYVDGTSTETLSILSRGRSGTPWETPSGTYHVITKETNHFSSLGHVFMPWSMQFFGNFFIHGWPYDASGTDVPKGYSGGCIRLSTLDAERVYHFVDRGTPIIVYTRVPLFATSLGHDFSSPDTPPSLSAKGYVAMDIDTGQVFAVQSGNVAYPDMTTTKFLSALASLEGMNQYVPHFLPVQGEPQHLSWMDVFGTLPAKDLIVPMLFTHSPEVENFLASEYGKANFLSLMNAKAKAFGMTDTQISGLGTGTSTNQSSPEDMMRLLHGISQSTSYLLAVTATSSSVLSPLGGEGVVFRNENNIHLSDEVFLGGLTDPAHGTLMVIVRIPLADGSLHRMGIGFVGSANIEGDLAQMIAYLSSAIAYIPEEHVAPEVPTLSSAERIRSVIDAVFIPSGASTP